MKLLTSFGPMIWYALLLVGLVFGVIFEYSFFTGKLQALDLEKTDVANTNAILTNRKNALSALTPEVIASSGKSTVALPPENSALAVTSQIRLAAQEHNITLRNFTVGTFGDPTRLDLGTVQVGLVAEGQTTDVLAFLARIPTLSPIMLLDSINLNASTVSTIAQVSIRSFWSPLPSKLPSITEPLAVLSPTEQEWLAKVDALQTIVATGSGQTALEGVPREAPFAPVP